MSLGGYPYARLDALGCVQPVVIDGFEALLAWSLALKHTQRVALDRIGAIAVSTVFLGVLGWPFETMLFGPHGVGHERWRLPHPPGGAGEPRRAGGAAAGGGPGGAVTPIIAAAVTLTR